MFRFDLQIQVSVQFNGDFRHFTSFVLLAGVTLIGSVFRFDLSGFWFVSVSNVNFTD